MMSLIRGVGSLFPCPRCLIPEELQGDLSASAPLRTVAGTKATIEEARNEWLAGDREKILKAAGLRDVNVRPCSYRFNFILLLITSLAEHILEDQQLGPTCRIIFRSSPYFPWWPVPNASVGNRQSTCCGAG